MNRCILLLAFLGGAGLMCSIFLIFIGYLDCKINILELLSVFATIALSILVFLLTRTVTKQDIIRNIVIDDLNELCSIYSKNSKIIQDLENEGNSLEEARKKINENFFKADLQIDRLEKEFKESFPKCTHKLLEITTPYYKDLTGGELMTEKKFIVNTYFKKHHETILQKTISDIKLLVHYLVKS